MNFFVMTVNCWMFDTLTVFAMTLLILSGNAVDDVANRLMVIQISPSINELTSVRLQWLLRRKDAAEQKLFKKLYEYQII